MFSKADLHIHTKFSDGLIGPEDLVDYVAAHTDLRVIAVTDHDTAAGAFAARDYAQRRRLPIEVIIGQEVTTDEGDVVGLFLASSLPVFRTADEAIRAIHEQGGLAVAVHPFSAWMTCGLMTGVGRRLLELPLDGVEVRNGFPTNTPANRLTAWVNRRRSRPLSELGGSDSHVPYTVGQAFTWFPGETARALHVALLERTTRPGGSLWRPESLARLLPIVWRKGLPHRWAESSSADEPLQIL